MSVESRPACPQCSKALVQQPSVKSYRCEPCKRTYSYVEAAKFKRINVETVP